MCVLTFCSHYAHHRVPIRELSVAAANGFVCHVQKRLTGSFKERRHGVCGRPASVIDWWWKDFKKSDRLWELSKHTLVFIVPVWWIRQSGLSFQLLWLIIDLISYHFRLFALNSVQRFSFVLSAHHHHHQHGVVAALLDQQPFGPDLFRCLSIRSVNELVTEWKTKNK